MNKNYAGGQRKSSKTTHGSEYALNSFFQALLETAQMDWFQAFYFKKDRKDAKLRVSHRGFSGVRGREAPVLYLDAESVTWV